MMRIAQSACKHLPSVVSFPVGLNRDNFITCRGKDKVVIVMGGTGTGKSRLSIMNSDYGRKDKVVIVMAILFPAEIVNSDKMQVYRGLDITSNKVTEEECQGIPHHLLGNVDPDEDFTALDFHHPASLAVESILRWGWLIMMGITLSACKDLPSVVSFPVGLNMDNFINPWRRKDKVVIVMGATGTGKSRLSIDLATLFPAEIVNCDKMQVYRGLDITSNKVTEERCRRIPHHLLGIVDPNEDFTALDFQHNASLAVESILRRGRLPIIAGGSNSYIKALVNDNAEFQSKYDCCFLCVDVSMPVLDSFLSERVNKMVQAGLVDEVRNFFHPEGDYSRGLRRAIGVPELDQYFRTENEADEATRTMLLEVAIEKIKLNTCQLSRRQLRNIRRLQDQLGWNMHHLDATEAFGPDSDEAWERLVAKPSTMIVGHFLEADHHDFVVPSHLGTPPPSSSVIAAAAATH